jgi:hypothetical protein
MAGYKIHDKRGSCSDTKWEPHESRDIKTAIRARSSLVGIERGRERCMRSKDE